MEIPQDLKDVLHKFYEGTSSEQDLLKHPVFQDLNKQLANKILYYGGKEVIFRYEPNILELLKKGGIFEFKSKQVKGIPCRCHQNVSGRYLKNQKSGKGKLRIATGYALSDDELWRQHSWLVFGSQILETTIPRLKYFGVVLNKEQTKSFVKGNLPDPVVICQGCFSLIPLNRNYDTLCSYCKGGLNDTRIKKS